jgi:hypothetical protein
MLLTIVTKLLSLLLSWISAAGGARSNPTTAAVGVNVQIRKEDGDEREQGHIVVPCNNVI